MKRLFVILLLLQTISVHAEGVIDGWVRVHGHQYPLYPVTVRVLDAHTGVELENLRTENRPDGTYVINNVPNGDYKVHYQPHGDVWHYLAELAGNRYCDNLGCDVTEIGAVITVEDNTRTLNINLLEGATMGGQVTDIGRRPLAGVTVEFYGEDGEPYCCARTTGEDGRWQRPVYFPAKYYVVARYDTPSEFRPQVYPRTNCSGCDILESGRPITIHFLQRFGSAHSRLERFPADPDAAIETVDVAKYSGSWFNPERDGEGFIVEVLDRADSGASNAEVAVFWFTYTPDGKQAWMVGTGTLNNRVAEIEFDITRGASFGNNFDPGEVTSNRWGSVRLEFLNCGQAYAQYAGEFGSGQINLNRLSSVNGLNCNDPDQSSTNGNVGFSGAWYNPEENGQGFIVEMVDDSSALSYWFTYDNDGSQMWMLGLGELDESGEVSLNMLRSAGGNFGDRFDPASVVLEEWGEVSLKFRECNQAAYSWLAQEPYGSGEKDLVRLTGLRGTGC